MVSNTFYIYKLIVKTNVTARLNNIIFLITASTFPVMVAWTAWCPFNSGNKNMENIDLVLYVSLISFSQYCMYFFNSNNFNFLYILIFCLLKQKVNMYFFF